MRGKDERERCFCLPAGRAGGEDDASALPSSFLDRGEARTEVAEQKRREKRQQTADRAGGGRKTQRVPEKRERKAPVALSSVFFGGALYPCEPEGCRFT